MKLPIKRLLLEGTLQTIIDNIKSKFMYFSNKFKYLNDKEFETLLNVIYGWYYLNSKFPDNLEKKYPEVYNLFEKIKKNNQMRLPSKLYRGLSFSTKRDRDNFLKEIKQKNLVNGKLFRLNQDTRYTGWSSSKKIAESFLPGGNSSHHDNFGILLTIDTKFLKANNITFSMTFLLNNESEIKDFLGLVLKNEYNRNQKYIKDNSPKKLEAKTMIGYQHGTIFSVTEDEFILNNVPFDICKVETKDLK